LTTPWLLTALVLYGLVALVGMFGYTATLRQQIQILDREGLTSPAYHTLAKRGMILGAILAVLVSLIVFLMVVKPRLWGWRPGQQTSDQVAAKRPTLQLRAEWALSTSDSCRCWVVAS